MSSSDNSRSRKCDWIWASLFLLVVVGLLCLPLLVELGSHELHVESSEKRGWVVFGKYLFSCSILSNQCFLHAGVNCEIDIDECVSNPCMNNATCQDGINNFTCKCQAGFSGYQCETNIDECEVVLQKHHKSTST